MSNSFYGGRDAVPMVIKKSFKTVQAMVDKFKEGNNYREVKFGEYVLIQSENKNNPENGMLFRRGRAYNNEDLKIQSWSKSTDNIFTPTNILAYGAEHLGTITGPSGNAPHLLFKQKEIEVEEEYNNNETSVYEIKKGNGEFSLKAENLVPGNPNSKITWTYCSIRDNNGNNTNAYIGFTIPYNVIEWETEQLSSQQNVALTNEQITPFYQKYKLGIPKGQNGTSFNNIRVITPTASDKVVTITFDSNRNITATDYAGLQDDISNKRKIWVADVVDYKTTDDGTQYLVYLGDYDTIKNISLTDKGLFTVEYYHSNDYTTNLKWPISTSLEADGTYTTTFNNNTSVSQTGNNRLKWVTGTSLNKNGTYTTIYNYGDPTIENNKIQWPTNIKVNSSGTITTDYNDGSSITQENPTMNWISSAELDKENTLKINYVNNKNVEQQNIVVPLKTVNSIRYDGIDGKFYITYNTGQEEYSIGAIGSSTLDAVTASEENEDTNSLRIGGIWFVTQE